MNCEGWTKGVRCTTSPGRWQFWKDPNGWTGLFVRMLLQLKADSSLAPIHWAAVMDS